MWTETNNFVDKGSLPSIAIQKTQKPSFHKGSKEEKQETSNIEVKKFTHMVNNDTRKQTKPIEKWSGKVDQKFCSSWNSLSEIRVRTPENNKNIHPEGKQPLKENGGFCRVKLIFVNDKELKKKNVTLLIKAYLEVAFDEYGRVRYPQNHIFYNSQENYILQKFHFFNEYLYHLSIHKLCSLCPMSWWNVKWYHLLKKYQEVVT